MKINKHHNVALLELLESNRIELDKVKSNVPEMTDNDEWFAKMESGQDNKEWLIEVVIIPALKAAIINQELKNF